MCDRGSPREGSPIPMTQMSGRAYTGGRSSLHGSMTKNHKLKPPNNFSNERIANAVDVGVGVFINGNDTTNY
jgi:hypothetical protein